MKKTLLFFTLVLTLCSFAVAKDFGDSEISIYNEVTAAFETGFYPGAVEKANLLQKEYPDSVFVLQALVQKGEALIYLGRYDEARETLEEVLTKLRTGAENFARTFFLLGKVEYLCGNYETALGRFHSACEIALADHSTDFYAPSMYYSAKILFLNNCYLEAIPLYEYIAQNGNLYKKADYEESIQKLAVCYNQTKQPQKAAAFINYFPKDSVAQDIYWRMQLSLAEAQELQSQYEAAFNTYTTITEEAPSAFGVIALKKAYIISTTKFGYVNGENFASSISAVAANPAMEQEFWLRLGIDEYNQNNPEKALEYFQKAGQNGAAIFYIQKLALDQGQNYTEIETALIENEALILESGFDNINDAYYALLLRCKALQQKWNEVSEVYFHLDTPDIPSIYNYISALYAKEDYKTAVDYLAQFGEPIPSEDNAALMELYASCLVKSGNVSDSNKIYKLLNDNKLLSNKSKVEYAKALFTAGAYKTSLDMATQSGLEEGNYIAGLCCINLRRWSSAQNYFVTYIKAQSNKPDFNKMALFYKGYAEYCMEDYKDSYATFVRFGLESGGGKAPVTGNNYVRSAYEYAAKCALQSGEFKNAVTQAENVIKASKTEEELQLAVLFSAEINTDNGNYNQAISILTPYTKQSGSFAITALFQIARVYEKQGNLSEADKTYSRIYTNYAGTELAEEAMYRCGEIFYSAGDFANAEVRLNKYVYKYVSGRFIEPALFYCGDCFLQLGEVEKSIMMNKTLVQKYPKSIYVYGTYKNLMTAYYESADYSAALDAAKYLVQNFQTQAASEGIGTKLKELEKIVSGTDPLIAEIYSDYEKAGKTSTKAGREKGTQLVQLYAKNPETKKEAFNLASELLALQKEDSEKYCGAQNAEFIADYYRGENDNKKAAEMYLLAAEYYRSSSESDTKAAAALYGAVEAFVAQGFIADAKETADLLIRLYPESKQAKNVKRLVK